jgi:hypothetical protein
VDLTYQLSCSLNFPLIFLLNRFSEYAVDYLDQDIQALKEWLRTAWRHLADPSTTRFERRELRNYMKEAEPALRTGLQKAVARERSRKDSAATSSPARLPDFRILNGKGRAA